MSPIYAWEWSDGEHATRLVSAFGRCRMYNTACGWFDFSGAYPDAAAEYWGLAKVIDSAHINELITDANLWPE